MGQRHASGRHLGKSKKLRDYIFHQEREAENELDVGRAINSKSPFLTTHFLQQGCVFLKTGPPTGDLGIKMSEHPRDISFTLPAHPLVIESRLRSPFTVLSCA